MPFGPASRLGVSLFDETSPLEWVPGLSADEAETMIKAVYRQVLGNAYVMESERQVVPACGNLSVRSQNLTCTVHAFSRKPHTTE
jgi:phycoerythrin-associated linker protein